MKDTFQTIAYKHCFIQVCQNRERSTEDIYVLLPDGTARIARSIQGAKRIITNHSGNTSRHALATSGVVS